MVEVVGNLFPLKPFVQSMQAAFNPAVAAPAFQWDKLAVIAAWGVVGVVLAARTFKWEPFADVGPSRRSRRTWRGRDSTWARWPTTTPAAWRLR